MDAHEIRMRIKALIQEARDEYPSFDFVGEVDELDMIIEATIRDDLFEVSIRNRTN